MKRLTKTQFKNWLESKSARTKVGFTDNFYSTPLFRFLKENKIAVNEVDYPKWAHEFNTKVLARSGRSVSANAALALLG